MKKEWKLYGGFGHDYRRHAYVYKYTGSNPQPVKERWKTILFNSRKKVVSTHYFKTQHEAIKQATVLIY